ncbi:MAG: NrfD/PsrC family molybdoenzyme membrane anchor subunit [Candidatus Zixiibacteriota bacterium]
MTDNANIKLGPGLWTLIVLTAIGVVTALLRYAFGIGFVSNLSDGYPWGIWIGFDVMSGVALAAGGFTTAAVVHIFGREKYHALVRPAILTAFLGYVLVIVALMVDLGRPWNIWRPLYHFQVKSVMFEVASCVALYTVVLAVEFAPSVLERFKMHKALTLVKKVTIGFVIAGVILSTMHQSSLGSVFLIVPHKLHPLWYTPILPLLFLASAIAVGPAMVIVEGMFSSKAFKRPPETELLTGPARAIPVILMIYLIMRGADLMARDAIPYLFVFNVAAIAFWLELLIGAVLPLALLLNREVYTSRTGQFWSALCVVIGVVMNRLNVAVTGITVERWESYYPAIGEILITIGVVCAGLIAFYFAVKNFAIYHEPRSVVEHGR